MSASFGESSVILFGGVGWASCGTAQASFVLVAGSGSVAPPIFPGGFLQLVPSADRAAAFTVAAGADYRVDELLVGVYRFPNLGGTTGEFAIHADASGIPGTKLVSFDVTGIPLSNPAIIAAVPSDDFVLQASTSYWLVGTTDHGQVNWSLAAGVFPLVYALGPNASNFNDAGWVVSQTGNLGTYAILGTPVPEPSTLVAGVAATLIVAGTNRRANRKKLGN